MTNSTDQVMVHAFSGDLNSPEAAAFLAHYGVVGMRWGKRKAAGSTSATPTRKQLRGMDKASKKADKAAHNAEIDAARERYKTSSKKNYKEAKAQYNIDKKLIGKNEARKALDKVKDQNIKDYATAGQLKYGKETAVKALADVGFSVATLLIEARNA